MGPSTIGIIDSLAGAAVPRVSAITPSSPARSQLMGRVRRSGTGPELALRRALHRVGLRYRLRAGEGLPGTPDIAFRRSRVAVFVDGCFWHSCPRHRSTPKANAPFWQAKIERNRARDVRANRALRARGWTVVRVWAHDVDTRIDRAVGRVVKALYRSRKTTERSSAQAQRDARRPGRTVTVSQRRG